MRCQQLALALALSVGWACSGTKPASPAAAPATIPAPVTAPAPVAVRSPAAAAGAAPLLAPTAPPPTGPCACAPQPDASSQPAPNAAPASSAAIPAVKGGTASGTRAKVTALGLKYCFPSSYDPKLRYVGVEVRIDNLTRTSLVVSDTSALLLDGTGQRFSRQRFSGEGLYTPRNDCYPDLQPFLGQASTLRPGETQRGWIHDFPVPPGARGFRVRFEIFTESEWRGPADQARPEQLEVVVGDQGVP